MFMAKPKNSLFELPKIGGVEEFLCAQSLSISIETREDVETSPIRGPQKKDEGELERELLFFNFVRYFQKVLPAVIRMDSFMKSKCLTLLCWVAEVEDREK